jgi:hypothetical protein
MGTALFFGCAGAQPKKISPNALTGTYNLVNYDIDLHGTLITDGSASAATTGFKSFLLKAASPFLKKKSGKQTVPFKSPETITRSK